MSALTLILIAVAAILFLLELLAVPAKFSLGALGGLCVCAALLIGRLA